MDRTRAIDDRDGLARTLLAVGLGVFALWSLLREKRLRGLLAGLGAVALGYSASTDSGDLMEGLSKGLDAEPLEDRSKGLDAEPTDDDDRLRCAICGEPIVPGQGRTPNEDDETVHETCLEATA